MELKSAFQRFAVLLNERFTAGVYTTEDSIRYTFCTALLSTSELQHLDLILEYPHPEIPGAEIDLVVTGSSARPPIAVEFKYDRGNPGGSNQNRTQRAAAVMADIFRLAKVPVSLASAKYFVYITDSEMAGYFRNPTNRLHEFFELAEAAQFAIAGGIVSESRFDRFSQPVDAITIEHRSGSGTLLTSEAIDAGRARIAAGEDPDKVALDLAIEEVWLTLEEPLTSEETTNLKKPRRKEEHVWPRERADQGPRGLPKMESSWPSGRQH
jgi:hypothetical protein